MITAQNKGTGGGINGSTGGTISQLIQKAGAKIAGAIQNASHKTGVDFSYLMQQAQIESSFRADVKSCSSSATGLYQFIDSTWLSMINKYGDKHGLSDLSNQISDTGKVSSTAAKKEILDLRKDPKICSLMAAEMASENKAYLEKCTGAEAGPTELYMAHFMGPGGAAKFLKSLKKMPDASAAALFPTAAASNKGVFYDKSGRARSLNQVYALFDQKFSVQNTQTACSTASEIKPFSSESSGTHLSSKSDALAALSSLPSDQSTAIPLYSKTSSLFIASDFRPETRESSISPFPKNLYGMLSPVDVLELLKEQYTGGKTNS